MRLFQIFDEMNQHDTDHKTQLIGVCPDFVSANKNGNNGKVTMGVPGDAVVDIMNNKYIPILLLVDKEEYEKRNKK